MIKRCITILSLLFVLSGCAATSVAPRIAEGKRVAFIRLTVLHHSGKIGAPEDTGTPLKHCNIFLVDPKDKFPPADSYFTRNRNQDVQWILLSPGTHHIRLLACVVPFEQKVYRIRTSIPFEIPEAPGSYYLGDLMLHLDNEQKAKFDWRNPGQPGTIHSQLGIADNFDTTSVLYIQQLPDASGFPIAKALIKPQKR